MWRNAAAPDQQRCMTRGNCKPILIQHSVRYTGSVKSLNNLAMVDRERPES